ncbi:hypothetical protein MX033_07800 [Streptococcus uberis]|uniref:hypothetical protein n=1 Tax=Streptococcus uberis TaxID=1349 RepID=UPI001FF5B5FA|nr:hypothetical protein [Streptococcus uberis]MCK1222614.1 hypothetical protein [Streptococcus uberis]MCK1241351.1 hypothetical protein [Streptococcus uberis]
MSEELKAYLEVCIAKADAIDLLLEKGWVKQSHLDYILNEIDPSAREVLEKEWRQTNA